MLTALSKVYQVKNAEIAWVAEFFYRCMVNTLKEQSSGLSTGMTVHAFARQAQWLIAARARLSALDHPIPDLPVTHPEPTVCDFSVVPDVLTDEAGRAVSSDCVAIATSWAACFAEACGSNSAGIAGGMLSFDLKRTTNNLAAVEQLLNAIALSSDVDFPETAAPEATPQKLGGGTRAKGSLLGK